MLSGGATVVLSLSLFPKAHNTLPEEWAAHSPLSQDVSLIPVQRMPRSSQGNFRFERASFPESDAALLRAQDGVLPARSRENSYPSRNDDLILPRAAFAECNAVCVHKIEHWRVAHCTSQNFFFKVTQANQSSFFHNCVQKDKPKTDLHSLENFEGSPRVRFRLDSRVVWSQTQQYTYNAQNSMLVDRYSLFSKSGSPETYITGSEMHLYAKPKFFFPLHFTEKDIQSEVVAYDQGPWATLAKLSFFLEVLFFRIRLKLTSSLAFLQDSIEIPLVLTAPISGTSFRSGSGFFYGFKSQTIEPEDVETDLSWLNSTARSPSPRAEFADQQAQDASGYAFLAQAKTCVRVTFEGKGPRPRLATSESLRAFGFPKVESKWGVFFDLTEFTKGEHRYTVLFEAGQSTERCVDLRKGAKLPKVSVQEMGVVQGMERKSGGDLE
jgi:hypothetical protein